MDVLVCYCIVVSTCNFLRSFAELLNNHLKYLETENRIPLYTIFVNHSPYGGPELYNRIVSTEI